MFNNNNRNIMPIDLIGISRGVDQEKYKIRAPQPMFEPRPFNNFMAEQMLPTDKSLMGYGHLGTFTPTVLSTGAQYGVASQMRKDSTIINLVNERRRRFF